MNLPGLILIGAGGHAAACIDVIEQQGVYEIAGLVSADDGQLSDISGYPILGGDEQLDALAKKFRFALVVVGQISTPAIRMRLYAEAQRSGFELPVIVAPSAYVSRSAVIGSGSIVMHGAIVNAKAKVGGNCIINSRALIEHDCHVGESCHVSTGAILNGAVKVGEGSFIGSGSIVKQTIGIGRRCIVGMGCVVRKDLADDTKLRGDERG